MLASDRPALNRLYDALCAAQQHRDQRREVVEILTASGVRVSEPGWVAHERQVMWATTNALRSEQGLGPVDMAAIERAEASAAGHVDYTKKFALHCEDLALGRQ